MYRKTLPEADSGYHGINCRPWSTLSEEFGSAWTEAVALAVAQGTVIHGGPSSMAPRDFAYSSQSLDRFGYAAPLPGLHSLVEVAPSQSRGEGRLLHSVQ